MKRIILMSLLALSTTIPALAQDTDNEGGETAVKSAGTSKPQPTVDLNSYIAENASLPASRTGKKETLRVTLKFTVDEQGEIGDVKVDKTSGDKAVDEEALRIVESMPKWKPAMKNGKPAKVYYTLPLKFVLEPENGDEKEERVAEKREKREEDKEEREERARERKDKKERDKEDD